MNTEKVNQFLSQYKTELTNAVRNFPDEYMFSVDDVPIVFDRMSSAFKRNSYNKDGRAWKATCKFFGIPHTYKAINQFVGR